MVPHPEAKLVFSKQTFNYNTIKKSNFLVINYRDVLNLPLSISLTSPKSLYDMCTQPSDIL